MPAVFPTRPFLPCLPSKKIINLRAFSDFLSSILTRASIKRQCLYGFC